MNVSLESSQRDCFLSGKGTRTPVNLSRAFFSGFLGFSPSRVFLDTNSAWVVLFLRFGFAFLGLVGFCEHGILIWRTVGWP